MPAIAEASLVQHTACLRPVAPDHLPIIGKAPGWDNVYLATGGAHKGILLSPAMGKAIADLITTGTTTLAIAPCAPERFTAVSA
jgi:glycine/D-amino acid oxidase-like deaminating enzyme